MKKLAIVLALFISACGQSTDNKLMNTYKAKNTIAIYETSWIKQRISYIEDKRTGLCFAVYNGYRESSIVIIPCSALIRKNELSQ